MSLARQGWQSRQGIGASGEARLAEGIGASGEARLAEGMVASGEARLAEGDGCRHRQRRVATRIELGQPNERWQRRVATRIGSGLSSAFGCSRKKLR